MARPRPTDPTHLRAALSIWVCGFEANVVTALRALPNVVAERVDVGALRSLVTGERSRGPIPAGRPDIVLLNGDAPETGWGVLMRRVVPGTVDVKLIRLAKARPAPAPGLRDDLAPTPLDDAAAWLPLVERERFLKLAGIVGLSDAIAQAATTLSRVAPTDVTVLLEGESGTGKEIFARGIHRASRRADGPYLALNCGAISPSLLESELFGHARGAFTGAVSARVGTFEAADGGTLLLDEVGELPLALQVKLLRVLEEHEIMRVGESRAIPTDVRLLAATNRRLHLDVDAGRFRSDLYYRLNVVRVTIPPLRERPEDLPLLAAHLAREQAERHGQRFVGFTSEALARLQGYHWPGNVRELRNVVENLVLLQRGEPIAVDDVESLLHEARVDGPPNLPALVEPMPGADPTRALLGSLARLDYKLDRILQHLERNSGTFTRGEVGEVERRPSLEEKEREALIDALEQVRGHRKKAASLLGLSERTLYRKLAEHGLLRRAGKTSASGDAPSDEQGG